MMRGFRHALRREVVKGVKFKCWGEFGKIEHGTKSALLSPKVVRARAWNPAEATGSCGYFTIAGNHCDREVPIKFSLLDVCLAVR